MGLMDWSIQATAVARPVRDRSLLITGLLLQADPNNTGLVYVGDADGQHVELAAGESESIDIDCPTKVYVRGNGVVNVHATNTGGRR